MENTRTSNRNFGMMAWGAIFLWWGITELFKFPNGTDAVGFGLIFLGVNVMRALNGIPTKRLTTMLGILALVWGGLNLAPLVLHLPFKLPVFAILLIVLGVILLAFVPLASSKDQFGGLVDTRFEAKCPRNASPRYLHFKKEFLTVHLENGRDVIRAS